MADSSHVDSNVITTATDSTGATVISVIQSNVTESSRVESVITTGGVGPSGAIGATGAAGATGTAGATGATGPAGATTPDATASTKGKLQLTGDIGGTATVPKIKRTSRFIVAPYGDTRPADYTCATVDTNQTEINQAIVAANALSQGGNVELLDGAFYISTSIAPLDNVNIKGQGMFATKIGVKAGLSNSFHIIDNFSAHNTDGEPTTKKWTISDLELDGSNMNNSQEGKGIFSIKLEDCVITRIYCHDTTATGIGADDYINSTVSGCIVSDCGYMNVSLISNIVYSVNTFTVTTSAAHNHIVNDEIVITGMTPRQYNGKYLITSITNTTTFVINTSNNAGKLQLSRDPGTATAFGKISDYNIGHSGIGIASGAYANEANLITDNICFRNQNNNIFVETNDNVTSLNASYIMSNNISYQAGQCGFRNTGTRNAQINNNFDYGSLIGGQMSAFYLTRTITAASWSGSVVTFTTSVAHAFTVDPVPVEVTVKGMTPSGYNGTYIITGVPSTTTFTAVLASDPGTATVFGTAYGNVHPVTGSTFKNNIFSHNVLYGYYHEPMGEDTEIIGNTIKYSQFYGAYLASGRSIFNDNKVYNNGRTGLSIPTGSLTLPITDITVRGNHIFNNSQNSAGTYDGIDIDSSATTPLNHVDIIGNHVYDNQIIQTQRYGVILRSGGSNSYITINNNDLTRNLTAPLLLQDTSDTIYVDNNLGVNPRGKSSLGNISGSVTFDCKLADYFKATVTGNLSPVMPASLVDGAIMRWVLVQDSTGGWTITLPGNAASQETLQLSSTANAIDVITWVYDLGTTKWRVISQSTTKQGTLNLADAANLALGATTGTKIGTSTAQKLAFFNSTPIVQPSTGTDLGTVLSNLGLRAAGTAYPITTSGAVILTGAVALNATTLATDTTTGLKIGTSTSQKLGFYNSTPIVQPTGDVATALQNLGLVATATVVATTNANLTGPITSVGNATSIASQTGTGTKFVVDTSPTLVTPTLGVATATSINKVGFVAPTTAATLAFGTDNTTQTFQGTDTIVGRATTDTLTNKRITQRIGTTASSATPTPDADAHDQYNVTALAAGATFGAPTGTPTDGQKLVMRIKDNGTARSLAFNAIYRAVGVTLPSTTTISKTQYVGAVYNAADTKWDVLAVGQEA